MSGDSKSSAAYHNKKIKIQCVVTGKSVSPYCVPYKVRIRCSGEKGGHKAGCPVSDKGHEIVTIKPVNENILKFIDVSSDKIPVLLKKIFNLKCGFDYSVIEHQNVDRIFIMPLTGQDRNKTDMANVSYFIGHGLEANISYEMEGYTTVDPKTQVVTHLFLTATKIKSDVDSFVLTAETHELLSEFRSKATTAGQLMDELTDLYDSYAHNITKIYGRYDLHMAIDLAFRSVLSFKFDNQYVHKGWSDVIVVGDTRCGKGYVAEGLVRYFGLGEVTSGENASIAGLVGGVQQIGGHWVLNWGKLPLADRKLLVVDEASELKDTDWSKLSRIRSEGVAEITKIHTAQTDARARLIFLANPPNKTISNYSHGIQALQDLVHAPEDQSRFDYALIVSHDEVDMADINKSRGSLPPKHGVKLEQDLLLWTWSRKSSEVGFSDEAITLIYKYANEFGTRYSYSIPLIQGESFRFKIAKVAIAIAARFYSNRKEGKILWVDKIHVEAAKLFFDIIYKKDASGYYTFSKLNEQIDYKKNPEKLDGINAYINSYSKQKKQIVVCLMKNNWIDAKIISEHLNLPQELAREMISRLIQEECIIAKSRGYVKTYFFTNYLKKKLFRED